MESVVKNSNLGNVLAENVHAGTDAFDVGRIVERSEVGKAFDTCDNLFCDKAAFIEESAALNDSVANCCDFAQIVKNLAFAACESFLNLKESVGVILEGYVVFEFETFCCGAADTAVDLDAFADALSDHLFIIHINKLILE